MKLNNKIGIYTRVSTEEQAKEGYSLEVQREYLESYANHERHEIYKVYSDEGISGFSDRRPALQELLEDAKKKKFSMVLVYKIDRFSRNLKDLLNLVDQLSSVGVGFKSATELFDTTTSAGKLMFQQLGSFAEFERNRIAERVVPGMKKSVLKGNWLGARFAPLGYDYDKEKKLLVVNKKEAEIVRLIYRKYLSGKSTRELSIYLNRKGIKAKKGGKFFNKVICDILKNPIYAGKIVWNKKHYDKQQKTKKHYKYIKNDPSEYIIAKGKHEAIISEVDFEGAGKKLQMMNKRIQGRIQNRTYLFSGLINCSKCNHPYRGTSVVSNHRTKEKKKWYRCSGPYDGDINCTNRTVKEEDIEILTRRIMESIVTFGPNADRWSTLTDCESKDLVNFTEMSEKSTEEVQEKLDKNRKKQAKLTDVWLDNLIGEDVYRNKQKELKKEEDDLKKTLAGIELSQMVRERSDSYVERVKEFFEGYDEDKKEFSLVDRREVAGLLFKNIKIAPPLGGAGPNKRIEFNLYERFNSLFSEAQKTQKWMQNQIVPGQNPRRSTLKLSDVK